jgi:hypothetical protein
LEDAIKIARIWRDKSENFWPERVEAALAQAQSKAAQKIFRRTFFA